MSRLARQGTVGTAPSVLSALTICAVKVSVQEQHRDPTVVEPCAKHRRPRLLA